MAADPLLRIELLPGAFEPLDELQDWHRHLGAAATSAAESLFLGRVRGRAADGTPLVALELEHYPGMSERQLQQLSAAAVARHGVRSALVLHRIGRVLPGQVIVLVAIGADRRGAAQRCSQELLEALKHEAPFWKREWRGDGSSRWLKGNTPF